MTRAPDDDTERIIGAWRELRRGAAASVLREHLLGADVTRLDQAQLDALEVLDSGGCGWPMSELADALRVGPSTATRAVDRLERRGLAERTTADGDGRIVIARPTRDGQRLLRRVRRLRSEGVEQLLAGFDDDERRTFADHLERFVGAIDELVADLDPPT